MPEQQLDWLKRQLKEIERPVILFTHCPVDDQDIKGNFFYETSDEKTMSRAFLANQESIQKIISNSGNIVAVFQAHLHYFHAKQIRGIPYITCPAMGDNICAPNILENIPEVYTIVSPTSNQYSAKAYSGKYCFAGYEWALL